VPIVHGQDLFQRAQGLDDRPVEAADETKSISKEITFNVDVHDFKLLTNTLQHLSDSAGLIGVGVSGFEDKPQQLGLWVDPNLEKKKHLQTTLDKLKDKFGERAIKRGNRLK